MFSAALTSTSGAPLAAPYPRRLAGCSVWAVSALALLVLGGIELSRDLGLWYDEDYTLLAVQTPLPALLRAVWHASPLVSWLTVAPSFNAPYYVVMHGWCAVFGTSALALRLPSLLCSAAAVAVLARAVQRLAGNLAGLTAGLLAATGPLLAQQAVEARPYGMAELAVALTVLSLVRRRQSRGARWPLAAAAGAAGLLHWFTLPVLAGLVVGLLALRRGGAVRDAVAIAAGCVPAAGLVVLQLVGSGDGTPIASQPGVLLAVRALADWSQGAWWLSAALLAAFALALVRSRTRGLLTAWTVLPLLLVTALDLLQPMYFGRYMLFTLLGLAAGAALGAASLPGRWRASVSAFLIGLSLLACVPRLQSEAREPQEQAVALLELRQVAGQPVAAGDGRAAVELAEEVAIEQSRLAPDLLLRPAHVPVAGTATVAWVVRSGSGATLEPSPNDAYLIAGGWALSSTTVLHGSAGDLTVQKWVR